MPGSTVESAVASCPRKWIIISGQIHCRDSVMNAKNLCFQCGGIFMVDWGEMIDRFLVGMAVAVISWVVGASILSLF